MLPDSPCLRLSRDENANIGSAKTQKKRRKKAFSNTLNIDSKNSTAIVLETEINHCLSKSSLTKIRSLAATPATPQIASSSSSNNGLFSPIASRKLINSEQKERVAAEIFSTSLGNMKNHSINCTPSTNPTIQMSVQPRTSCIGKASDNDSRIDPSAHCVIDDLNGLNNFLPTSFENFHCSSQQRSSFFLPQQALGDSDNPSREIQSIPNPPNASPPPSKLSVVVRVRPASKSVPCQLKPQLSARLVSEKHCSDLFNQGTSLHEAVLCSSARGSNPIGMSSGHENKFIRVFVDEKAIECTGFTGSKLGSFGADFDKNTLRSKGALRFTYNAVFDEKSTQEDIMREVGEKVVDRVLLGYHGTVLCYGQSGCGKTYSLIGPEGGNLSPHDIKRTFKTEMRGSPDNLKTRSSFFVDPEDCSTKPGMSEYKFKDSVGLLPRMLLRLFQELNASTQSPALARTSDGADGAEFHPGWSVFLNAVELYNEQLRDLIPQSILGNRNEGLRQDKKRSTEIEKPNIKSIFFAISSRKHKALDKQPKAAHNDSNIESLTEDDKNNSPEQSLKSRTGYSNGNEGDRRLLTGGRITCKSPSPVPSLLNVKGISLPSGISNISEFSYLASSRKGHQQTTLLDNFNDTFNSMPGLQFPSVSRSPYLTDSLSHQNSRCRMRRNISHRPSSSLRIRDTLRTGDGMSTRESTASTGLSVTIDGLRTHQVQNFEEAMQVVFHALVERKMASTRLNINSNRAHTLFFIHVIQKDEQGLSVKHSVLTLVDLAGSERVSQTGANGARLLEARKINLSLLLLRNVIRRLSEHQREQHLRASQTNLQQNSYIPYRNSNLTRLLQDSFGGNTITFLLCNISLDEYHIQETLSTLRFASLTKEIKNKPIANTQLHPGREFAHVNECLRIQLNEALRYITLLKEQVNSVASYGATTDDENSQRRLSFSGNQENPRRSAVTTRPTNWQMSQQFLDASNEPSHSSTVERLESNLCKNSSFGATGCENRIAGELGNDPAANFVGSVRKIKGEGMAMDTNVQARLSPSKTSELVSPLPNVHPASMLSGRSEKLYDSGRETIDNHSPQFPDDFKESFFQSSSVASVGLIQNVSAVVRFFRSFSHFLVQTSPIRLGESKPKIVNMTDKTDTENMKKSGELGGQSGETHASSCHAVQLHSHTFSLGHNISLYFCTSLLSYLARHFKAIECLVDPMNTRCNYSDSKYIRNDDALTSALNQCFDLKLLGYVDAEKKQSR